MFMEIFCTTESYTESNTQLVLSDVLRKDIFKGGSHNERGPAWLQICMKPSLIAHRHAQILPDGPQQLINITYKHTHS